MHYADRRVVDDILAAKTLPIMISRVIVTIDSGKVKMHESDNAGIHWDDHILLSGACCI